MSSVHHDDLTHLKIPLESIISATNNFADKNSIGEADFVNHYKGQLVWSGELIKIHAQRWPNKEWDDEKEQQFWMEISLLSSLKHKNLVSLVGFCDENDEKIIIIKRETRGMLSDYLSDPMLLTWVRRLEISIGLAKALSYIHYDELRDFSVIHRNIDSETVLLNDNWEPKLCEFRLSMKIKASERHDLFRVDKVWDREGYTDPTYLETKSVSYKSDIYSFGIVLFEVLCGRKSKSDDQDNKYLVPMAIFHYREKLLQDIIDPDLLKQMDPQSFKVFAETAYDCLNEEQSQRPNIDEIVARLEKALELQLACDNGPGSLTSISTRVESHVSKKTKSFLDDLSHFKLNFQDIESATNNFDVENIIEKVKLGTIYKGRLEQFIDIIVKRFYTNCIEDKSKRFWTEVLMLSSLRHKNLVSFIGFYESKDNKIIIYKKEANRSLNEYLSDQTLTWMQRLKICVGVAKALSYIHYDPGRDFSVIHCNIMSSNILLDDKWEPKLSGFELSLKNTVARRHRLLLTRDVVKNVYMDPKYKKTGGVTHKSDVYSFGVVLFEVLCGRSAVDEDEDKDEDEDENEDEDKDEDKNEREDESKEGLFSQLAKSYLDDMIYPHLRKQMNPEALKVFTETAYWCIKEERADRPYIDQVVKRLDKALKLQWRDKNPELPENAADDTSSNHLKLKNLEHLKIGLNDIEMATEKFAQKHCIGVGGYGMVYKGELEHFDSSISSSIQGKNKCDFPKKRNKVAVKRMHNRKGEQGFIAEIEILTCCKHENIISLLGFCDEDPDHMILVYELASRGSLEDYLGNSNKSTNLTWVQRLKICLDIAHGLNYIHANTDQDKKKIIHRDIKSANILLDENWEAKITDFGLSKFHPANQAASTINTDFIAGTAMYVDPEYQKYGRLHKKSDIYSFGVVLLEIMTGRLAYDRIFTDINGNGIAPIARHHFEKGTLMEIVDHKIKEERDEHVFSLSMGPNEESFDTFSKIAFRCIGVTQVQRPSIDVVINELKKALYSQENNKDSLKLSLQDIKLATKSFNQDNLIGHGDFGNVYKGYTHGHNVIAAKRLGRKSAEGEAEFKTELEILMEHKHENVIGIVGYCDEEDEKIIVYEYASRGSLDKYLSDDSLTWVTRLKICIDIAIGLEFLHGTISSPEMVIHRDINSSNILLFDDWKAKISDFGFSLVCPVNHDAVIDKVTGTIGYRDPLYSKTGFLTKESDIFSLGAVLFDILCGKLSSIKLDDECLYLPFLAKYHYHLGKLDKLVFEGIKEQIVAQSYITFTRIALQCIHHRRERRPTTHEVVIQLKKALEFQENSTVEQDNSIVEDTSSFIHKKFQHLKIELQAIRSATNEFDESHCIGKGGFGKVYMGELVLSKRRSVVALKRLDRAFGQGDPEFWKEIIMLSQYRHDNIVSLLGFCDDCGEKILVYDYASKRSLNLYLDNKDLMWVQRLEICIGAARGLAYLHNPAQTQQRVLHRDIKSSNILLDENWNARIADFGLSKFGPANQQFTFLVSYGVGTFGYCDPLYVETGLLTKESDVYSFGVVLFEVLCGRLCINNSKPLTALVRKCYEEKTIADIVYGKIKDEINPDSLKAFTTIAYQCLKRDQEQRPSMTEVVKVLESALMYQVSNEPSTSSLSRELRIS